MQPNDDKLSALLKRWPEIEPPASFEANVKRRIREAKAPWEVLDWWREFLRKPAFGVAVAVAASIVIGASAGMVAAPHSQRAELQFMSSGTLAGGYVKLASGDHR